MGRSESGRSVEEKDSLADHTLRHSGVVVVVGGILAALVLSIGFFWAPTWNRLVDDDLRGNDEATAEDNVRTKALGVATAIAAATAGALAWARLELSRREDRRQHDAQYTDRYRSAVEQLGHNDTSVRLGGLYALQSLARDSAPHRDTIVEVICAYVRHHSVQRDPSHQPSSSRSYREEPKVDGNAVDYRAAIEIALRAPPGWHEGIRDLRGCVLSGQRLTTENDDRYNLDRLCLRGATLRDVELTNATLEQVDLQAATLESVELRGATLKNVDFSGARFTNVSFKGGDTTLTDVDFSDTRLFRVQFTDETRVTRADFHNTSLTWAGFGEAVLEDVSFSGKATLTEVRFIHSTLTNVEFTSLGRFDPLKEERIFAADAEVGVSMNAIFFGPGCEFNNVEIGPYATLFDVHFLVEHGGVRFDSPLSLDQVSIPSSGSCATRLGMTRDSDGYWSGVNPGSDGSWIPRERRYQAPRDEDPMIRSLGVLVGREEALEEFYRTEGGG